MNTKNRGRFVVLAAGPVLLAGTAPSAIGAVASTEDQCQGGHGGQPKVCDVLLRPTFKAAPGEVNQLVVTRSGKFGVFRDAGAPVTTQGRCMQVDTHTARCPLGTSDPLVLLDDGNDTLAPSLDVDAFGGEGNDTFTGYTGADQFAGDGGDDVIDGAAGDDTLEGGAGRDTLTAGPGSDFLVDGEKDGAFAPDTYDGGEGVTLSEPLPDTHSRGDTISYDDRTQPVVVDLATASAGPDGDTFAGIENVLGGAGADRLTAPVAGGILLGAGGNDTLIGGPGPDTLTGGDGADSFSGGDGDDVLETTGPASLGEAVPGTFVDNDTSSPPYVRETLNCGTGNDAITTWYGNTVAGDCESFVVSYDVVALRPTIRADVATFRCSPCSRSFKRMAVRLGESGSFGKARFKKGRASVRLSQAALAAIEARSPIKVRYIGHLGYTTPLFVP